MVPSQERGMVERRGKDGGEGKASSQEGEKGIREPGLHH